MYVNLPKLRSGKTILIIVLLGLGTTQLFAQQSGIKGFSANKVPAQLELEKKFDAQLSNSNIGLNMKELAAKPHHLGSAQGKIVAK